MGSAVRIAFPFAGNYHVGGAHVSALKVIEGLDRSRFAPIVVLTGPDGDVSSFVRDRNVDVLKLPDLRLMAPRNRSSDQRISLAEYAFSSVPRMIAWLRSQRIDIVHTNDGQMHANWALPTRLGGAAHVWHHREDPAKRGANIVAPFLASRIVSVSEFARPKRPLLPISSRFRVVRSPFDLSEADGVDPARERNALTQEIGAGDDAVLLGYVGALTARKRPDHFIRAIARIQKALPGRDVRGLLFGRPPQGDTEVEGRLRECAEAEGIADKIKLMGHRSPLAGPMSALDAMLVPALNEPFGRTLIEAMNLGVPVVATRHGGNVEAIDDSRTGYLVDPADPGAFVEPVVTLQTDQELRTRMAQAARAEVRARFGVASSVAGIEAVYDEVRPAGKSGIESAGKIQT